MSTVLTNGIIIPDNGSRNWGGDLANNWNIIDLNVGYMTDVKNRVTTLENSVAENSANIQINTSNISALQTSKQDAIEDLETIRAGASAGATAVQPSALNNYVDLSSGQTIDRSKVFTSQIVGSIDEAEKDLAGNIITSTYATKSELSYKANDSDVVHKSEFEVISGTKAFTSGVYAKSIEFNQNSEATHGGYIDFHYAASTEDYTSRIIESDKGKLDINGCHFRSDSVSPSLNNYCNLGTSANKWKTLNGINPGALSLPNPSPSAFISKALPASGGTITADVDSWFEIRTKATSPNALIQLFVAGGNATYAKNTGDTLIISVPMRAGISVTIFYKDIETPSVCRLIPCLGNI